MIAIQVLSGCRVALCTIFKASTELRKYFKRKKFKVHEVGYPMELDIPRLDVRGSTVIVKKLILTFF